MAFKRSAVRSRLSPPQITPTFVRKPVFFLLSGLVVAGARLFIYHFSTTLPSKLLSQGVCHIRFSGRVQVSVDIGGHLDVSMAQPLLHVLQGPAHGDEHTGATVPLRYNYDKPEKPRRIKGFRSKGQKLTNG